MYDVGKTGTLPPTPTYIYDVGVGKANTLPPRSTLIYDIGVGGHVLCLVSRGGGGGACVLFGQAWVVCVILILFGQAGRGHG